MDRKGIGFELNEEYCESYPELKDHLQEQQTTAEAKPTQEKLDRLICIPPDEVCQGINSDTRWRARVREAVSARYS